MSTLLSNRQRPPAHAARSRLERRHPAGLLVPDGAYRPVVKLLRSTPHDHAAERDPDRHDAAEDRRQAPAVPDHLARRRRAPRRLHLPLRDQRARRTRSCSWAATRCCSRGRASRPATSPGTAGCPAARGRAPAATCSRSRPQDVAGNRAKALPVRDRARALRRARPDASRRARRAPGSRLRVSTDATDGALALERPPRRASARDAASSCAASRRASSTCTSSPGTHGARSSVVVGMSAGVAQARRRRRRARPRAALRRAASRPARRRASRSGRSAVRAARRLPRAAGHHRAARGRRRVPRRCRRGVDLAGSARPVAARARDARLRARAHPGARRLDAGEPAAAALRRRRRRRRSRSPGSCYGDDSNPLGSGARAAAPGRSPAFVAWDGACRSLWSKDPQRRARSSCSSSCSRSGCSRSCSRGSPGRVGWVLALYVQLALMALVVRRDRDRPVRDAEHLLEPEGARRQRVRARAAGSTGSTPSSTTRRSTAASSWSRSSRASSLVLVRRGDPLWAVAAALAIVVTWVGLLPVVLAVELPRARWSGSRSPSWSRGGATRASRSSAPSSCCSAVASPQLRHRDLGTGVLSHATGGRSTLVSTGLKVADHHPLVGVGSRRLQARLRQIWRTCAARSRRRRVAHDADHRRRRDRRSRACCSSSGSSSRPSSLAFRRLGRDFDGARPSRVRTSLGRDPRALRLLQRALRRPARSGACSR